MDESRRRFLQDMTALGAASTVASSFAAGEAQAEAPQQAAPQHGAQAQPATPPARGATAPAHIGLPHVHLMIGPGTLPSVGKDRMDLLRYRLSGNPRLTGEQMLEPLPEIAKVARVEVDKGNP